MSEPLETSNILSSNSQKRIVITLPWCNVKKYDPPHRTVTIMLFMVSRTERKVKLARDFEQHSGGTNSWATTLATVNIKTLLKRRGK